MTKTRGALRLHRETVRQLSDVELERVGGQEATLLTCPFASVCELASLLLSCEIVACF
jgi:hypothetical protein